MIDERLKEIHDCLHGISTYLKEIATQLVLLAESLHSIDKNQSQLDEFEEEEKEEWDWK